ncbi:MAG: hypothetical protein NHB36_00010 [Nitrospira sp.]|nr:hypothetical protein [Nitrospira sp.]
MDQSIAIRELRQQSAQDLGVRGVGRLRIEHVSDQRELTTRLAELRAGEIGCALSFSWPATVSRCQPAHRSADAGPSRN